MNNIIPDISKQVNKESIFEVLEEKYSILGPIWVSNQMEWLNGVFEAFNDHDKFVILIYLTKKTLDIYANNLTKLTYNEFYSNKTIEIEKINISDISSALRIPKESARRKVFELENEGVIRRKNKKILIDRSCFNYSQPIDSIKRISIFLSILSNKCKDKKILSTKLTSTKLELVIKNNFSNIWNLYYEIQIPMLTNYKKIFIDLETFHIFGVCAVNQHLGGKKLPQLYVNRNNFINDITTADNIQGINAMSISDITGIPRATVIRKLKKLVKKNFLIINKKKHYKLGELTDTLSPIQKNVLINLASFSAKIFNLAILAEKQDHKI